MAVLHNLDHVLHLPYGALWQHSECIMVLLWTPPQKRFHGQSRWYYENVFRNVKSGKYMITTPQEFANYTDEKIIGVTTLSMWNEKIFNEPEKVKNTPKIPITLHCGDINIIMVSVIIIFYLFYFLQVLPLYGQLLHKSFKELMLSKTFSTCQKLGVMHHKDSFWVL